MRGREEEQRGDAGLLAVKMEGHAMSHGLRGTSESWKREENKFPAEFSEGVQPASTLI